MKFIKTKIPEIIIFEPTIYEDERGDFMETFRLDKLEQFLGYKINFIQDNQSKSSYGVIRGLHYQLPPFAQTKLINVICGKVLDIAVDIRKKSPTFGQYVSVELSSINNRQLLIPRGFAHGFISLEDDTVVTYKVDNYYSSKHERGIAFDDEDIRIDWSCDKPNLSKKDKSQPKLAQVDELFEYGVNYYV